MRWDPVLLRLRRAEGLLAKEGQVDHLLYYDFLDASQAEHVA